MIRPGDIAPASLVQFRGDRRKFWLGASTDPRAPYVACHAGTVLYGFQDRATAIRFVDELAAPTPLVVW